MINSSTQYLASAFEGMTDFREAVNEKTGSFPSVLTRDERNVSPPCVVIYPNSCDYALNGGTGLAEMTVLINMPLYGDTAVADMAELCDIVGGTLYRAAGRGRDGTRITGIRLGGISEDEDYPGFWVAAFNITIMR